MVRKKEPFIDFDAWSDEADEAVISEYVANRQDLKHAIRPPYIHYLLPEGEQIKLPLTMKGTLLVDLLSNDDNEIEALYKILQNKADEETIAIIDGLDLGDLAALAKDYISVIAKVLKHSLGKFGS